MPSRMKHAVSSALVGSSCFKQSSFSRRMSAPLSVHAKRAENGVDVAVLVSVVVVVGVVVSVLVPVVLVVGVVVAVVVVVGVVVTEVVGVVI